MIVRIREEKFKVEVEAEKLKINIYLVEKEISLLKYDVYVVFKEVEIWNEEKNMSLKLVENVNRQYLEGVKKIAKLEGECQRLRGLLRKKFFGFGVMVQMKLEVESLGYEFIDYKWEEFKRENVNFIKCIVEMEEEIQIFKEFLVFKNNELNVSRNVCVKIFGKFKVFEVQMYDQYYLFSVILVLEDGFDEEGSLVILGDFYKVRKVNIDGFLKFRVMFNRFELMDDFLEIEKLVVNDLVLKFCNSVCSSKYSEKDDIVIDQFLMVLCLRISSVFEF